MADGSGRLTVHFSLFVLLVAFPGIRSHNDWPAQSASRGPGSHGRRVDGNSPERDERAGVRRALTHRTAADATDPLHSSPGWAGATVMTRMEKHQNHLSRYNAVPRGPEPPRGVVLARLQ